MSEMLEYQSLRTRMAFLLIGSCVFQVGGAVILATEILVDASVANELPAMAMGFVCWLLAALMLVGCYAMQYDGYCRKFMEFVHGEFDYPAIEEWKDSLEERDMFTEEL